MHFYKFTLTNGKGTQVEPMLLEFTLLVIKSFF